jgi:ABC-2 type transport system ATP-binding protein
VRRSLPGLGAVLLAVTVGLPHVDAPLRTPWAPLLGVPVALALFATVVRRRPTRLPSPIVSAVLGVGAALEELFWRGLVLGALTLAAGAAGALAVSSALFASVHRRRRLHLLTGAAFGALYLVTGWLLAPMVAHAAYNVLVCSAAELRGAGKRFGDTVALDDVDLDVRYGDTLALVGPNGAGKSTAVSLLLGLRRPDAGAARLCGLDPTQPSARRTIGVVPQEIDLPPALRVAEIVDLVRAHHPAPEARGPLLERFGLARLARRQAGGLSAGQRRRVALALAFAGRPRLLFLDEPTAGLDLESRQGLWRDLRAHAAQGGATLLTTHHLDEVATLADRLVVLKRGRVVGSGTVDEIRAGRSLEEAVAGLTSE